MKKMMILAGLILMILHSGCKKENNEPKETGWAGHILVVNEGPYQTGSGSITAYHRESGEVTGDLFQMVNGRPLGNIVQSISAHNGRYYIVVNNANRVEVVDQVTFASVGSFENVSFPASFQGFDEKKGYLSCWDGTVKVLDLEDFTVTGSIAVGAGPEKMLLSHELWVLNTGGFGVDSTISIIDTGADTVKKTLVTGHVPSGIVSDAEGKVWVLCSGRGWNGFPAPEDTPGRLIRFHDYDHSVMKEFEFSSSSLHPDLLVIDHQNGILFYNHPQGIFSVSTGSTTLPEEPLVARSSMLYGIGFDPVSKMLLGADAGDYVQDGWVYFYRPADGSPMDTIQAGIIPNGFWTGD